VWILLRLKGSSDENRYVRATRSARMDAYLLDATAEPAGRLSRQGRMQRRCLNLAPTLVRRHPGPVKVALARGESPANDQIGTPRRSGAFLGYYREERYVCCLWEVAGIRLRVDD
jgi:hypothetical protein